jgi:hypothetical protein
LRFSGSYLASARLPRVLQPTLDRLAAQTAESFSAVVLDGDQVVIVARSGVNTKAVIDAVNKSFASNADDALLTYLATNNDDTNFLGATRANVTLYRQTKFVVALMDGTAFGGGTDPLAVDPRMSRMLSPAPDGGYRGLDPNVLGFGALAAAQQPNNFFGYPGNGGVLLPSRYIFDNKSKIPLMTYSQLQFIKAEAALKMGDQATALAAYKNGISSHIDFVNARNLDANGSPTQISASGFHPSPVRNGCVIVVRTTRPVRVVTL